MCITKKLTILFTMRFRTLIFFNENMYNFFEHYVPDNIYG
jgi:hypothetical protein